MEGWTRDMSFRDTGLPWVAPSTQIPTPEHAAFYAVSGVIGELYSYNTGIGYTLPFQCFATDYIDANKLADAMNALNLPGLRFRPINYKPFFALSVALDKSLQEVHGVEVYITDLSKANLTLTQFYFMQVMHQLYPDKPIFDANSKRGYSMFDKVMGTDQIRMRFIQHYMVEDILDYFNKDVESFKAKSSKYYLYH